MRASGVAKPPLLAAPPPPLPDRTPAGSCSITTSFFPLCSLLPLLRGGPLQPPLLHCHSRSALQSLSQSPFLLFTTNHFTAQ
ncbi:hypothetical protein SESBI_36161 [Sesbania bispinosa]|nr:hypothetical protein SESBI_36161 [Sesbania bispinosa]